MGETLTLWPAVIITLSGILVGFALVIPVVAWSDMSSFRSPLLCQSCRNPSGRTHWLPWLSLFSKQGRCNYCGASSEPWIQWFPLLSGGIFLGLTWCVISLDCQSTPEVRPSEWGRVGRLVYHLVLISLLLAATATDFREYLIPDQITFTGMIIGVLGATLAEEFQLAHLWVDWNQEIPKFRGPYIPDWMDAHRHLHGLAWSLTGLLVGGGMVWIVRGVSSLILGEEALGFGDVTLMAMVGAFVGWQPVIFALLLAPLAAILCGLAVRILTGRTYVPYGPYLSLSTLGVLCSWKWLWMWDAPWSAAERISIRHIFGDWISLAMLAGVSLFTLCVLLGMVRIYRRIPVQSRARPLSGEVESPENEQGSDTQPESNPDDEPQAKN